MRALALLLLLACGQAWGVTYYLDTSCTFNGNGTGASGACAASAAAAGAYNTGASIAFGAGDTIFIKRGTTVTNFPTPISQSLTVDDYGTATDRCPIISRTAAFTISISAASVTLNDLCLTGTNTSSTLNMSAASASINRVEVYGNLSAGARGVMFNAGSDGSAMTDSIVHDIDDDGIGVATAATGTVTITNQTCYRIDLGAGLSGDCLQAYVGTAANVIVDGGIWTRETANKQALIYDGSGTFTIRNKADIDVRGGLGGIQVAGTGAFNLTSASIVGGASCDKGLHIISTGTATVTGLVLSGCIDGVYVAHASGTVNIQHASITGQTNSAIYHTTGGSMDVKNSYMDAPFTIQDASAAATTTANYNRYGRASWQWNGGTISSLASWQSTTSQDANSAVLAETFVGGTSPTTKAGFCLLATSTLLGAGLYIGPYVLDAYGRTLSNPPAIGAIQSCLGRAPSAPRVPVGSRAPL